MTKDFWPYWRKTVERFGQLNIKTLKLGRYDVTRNQIPEKVEIDSLPALVMFPAKDKVRFKSINQSNHSPRLSTRPRTPALCFSLASA